MVRSLMHLLLPPHVMFRGAPRLMCVRVLVLVGDRGGPKLSGLGRDNGEAGFMSYLEPKQVVEWVTKDRLGWYNLPSKL